MKQSSKKTQYATSLVNNRAGSSSKPLYVTNKYPVYQIDFTCAATGKSISVSKRRVRWRLGFSSAEAIDAGLTGTECRGEEHEVVLIWSIASGKRMIMMDGQEVHFSNSKESIVQYTWTIRGNHTAKIIAHSMPQLINKPGWHQFDFILDGSSFFEFPKIYELGISSKGGGGNYSEESIKHPVEVYKNYSIENHPTPRDENYQYSQNRSADNNFARKFLTEVNQTKNITQEKSESYTKPPQTDVNNYRKQKLGPPAPLPSQADLNYYMKQEMNPPIPAHSQPNINQYEKTVLPNAPLTSNTPAPLTSQPNINQYEKHTSFTSAPLPSQPNINQFSKHDLGPPAPPPLLSEVIPDETHDLLDLDFDSRNEDLLGNNNVKHYVSDFPQTQDADLLGQPPSIEQRPSPAKAYDSGINEIMNAYNNIPQQQGSPSPEYTGINRYTNTPFQTHAITVPDSSSVNQHIGIPNSNSEQYTKQTKEGNHMCQNISKLVNLENLSESVQLENSSKLSMNPTSTTSASQGKIKKVQGIPAPYENAPQISLSQMQALRKGRIVNGVSNHK